MNSISYNWRSIQITSPVIAGALRIFTYGQLPFEPYIQAVDGQYSEEPDSNMYSEQAQPKEDQECCEQAKNQVDEHINSDTKVKQSGLSKSMPYTVGVEMNVVSTIVIFSIEVSDRFEVTCATFFP